MGTVVEMPDWSEWANVPDAEDWQAVLLSMDVEPHAVKHNRDAWMAGGSGARPSLDSDSFPSHEAFADYEKRLRILQANVSHNRVRVTALTPGGGCARIDLRSFAAWALNIGWSMPTDLEALARKPSPEVASAEAQRAQAGRWPWGDYTTEMLDKLAEAAHEFWCDYDPRTDIDPPTNANVSEWLQRQGVTKNLADAMASILRPDGLATGRRSGKG